MPDKITDFITVTLDNIPIIDTITNYIMSFSETKNINSFSLFSYTIEAITSSIVRMYVVGTCVHVFKKAGELIGIRGIPAIQTILGIFCSCLLLKFIGNSLEYQIGSILLLMIIDFILAVIVQKGQITKFFADVVLGTGIATITAGTVCAYCTVLVLIIRGYFQNILSAINILIWALIPAMICLLIDYLLLGRKD